LFRHFNDFGRIQRQAILALSYTVSEQEGGQKGGQRNAPRIPRWQTARQSGRARSSDIGHRSQPVPGRAYRPRLERPVRRLSGPWSGFGPPSRSASHICGVRIGSGRSRCRAMRLSRHRRTVSGEADHGSGRPHPRGAPRTRPRQPPKHGRAARGNPDACGSWSARPSTPSPRTTSTTARHD